MSKNGQALFKKLTANAAKIFKVCLTMLERYALQGQ